MTEKNSELIERLFNTVSCDPTMPADLKISLLRLQLPMHKISLSDSNFSNNPKHPARRTLFIAKKLSALSKNNTSIIRKIDIILSELHVPAPDVNKFSIANIQLKKLITLLQTSRDNQTLTSKKILNNKIKSCILNHDIPKPCQGLILKLWPIALFKLLKSHGETSAQWINAINMYKELLSSIQPLADTNQYIHIKENYMNIARSNNNMLLLYHQEDKVETEIKSLIGHYNTILKTSSFSSDKTSGNTQKSPLSNSCSLPPSIKPGIWCEIYIDDVTPPRRLRLSLIKLDSDVLIFVNRNGIKKLEKNLNEFVEELNRGLSKVYKHDNLFTKPSSKTQFQKIG
ncbi:MAG: hypothetical protein DIZ80_11000 [endosymbiont of Galathealinum brachiosum]|uniref:Uncharacterized protein n=1 Tax=endosymbiont of Galathealinum brachiosum TaxID=2200906 RepID=A0A370DEJ0_9GAMM|nr:MAG: hypothetical protein DIZ80_11000 [endosymbiont of Galathealinum brachiosum]